MTEAGKAAEENAAILRRARPQVRRFHIPRGFIVGKNRVHRYSSVMKGTVIRLHLLCALYIRWRRRPGREDDCDESREEMYTDVSISMSVDASTLHMRVYEKVTVTIIRSARKETRSGKIFVLFLENFVVARSREIVASDLRERKRECAGLFHLVSRKGRGSLTIVSPIATYPSIETRETQRSTTSTIKDFPR